MFESRHFFMTLRRTLLLTTFVWVGVVSAGHVFLNMRPSDWFKKEEERKMRIGFLPVTCHLTCPVTDFINKEIEGEGLFEPIKFNGWPELKEAFLSGHTRATFILAPMAIALREQGVPIKLDFWQGLFAPKGTPRAIVDKLNAAFNEAMTTPDAKADLERIGIVRTIAGDGGAQAAKAYFDAEYERWGAVIRDAGIRIEQ